MMSIYLIQTVMIALSYYFFSNEFFLFSADMKCHRLSFLQRFFMFAIVYVWFLIASMLELPLVINWLIFLVILGIEVYFMLSFDFLTSYALSMFCIIIGLAINIFFRSLMSITMNVPLHVFDNTINSIKQYPIFLGFVFMGLLFYFLRRHHFHEKLQLMLQNREGLVFYSRIEGCVYLFLIIQLLAYSQTDSNMGIKLWGIKAAVFSIIAMLIANIYTLRVASLHLYMNKQHEIHNQLIQEKKDINNLWKLAYTDMLTNCNNRQLLDKRLKEYAGYGGKITLAFIDLNGLKIINDQFGHLEGDHYLITTSQILTKIFQNYNADLFRYGGDEFVLMSNSLGKREMEKLLEQANHMLQTHTNQRPFSQKSISFGIVQGNSIDYQDLMKEADKLMYQHKMEYYEHLARI